MGKAVKRIVFSTFFCFVLFHSFAERENTLVIAGNSLSKAVVEKAYEYLGTPYVYGGEDKNGVDCSGLVYAVFLEAADKKLYRKVSDLFYSYKKVKGMLYPGDLLFFNTVGGISHVGISLGGNRFIHAASSGPRTGVIVSSLQEKYYKKRYLGARRIIEYEAPLTMVLASKKKSRKKIKNSFLSGKPVFFTVKNIIGGLRFVTFTVFKNSEMLIEKRIRVSYNHVEPITWFTPDAGEWAVSIRDDRKKELLTVYFSVGKGNSD